METDKYSQSAIQQAYKTASSKYATPDQRDAALHILAVCMLLTEAVKEDVRIARRQRWADQCKRIVTMKERELSAIWFDLSLNHEIEQDLESWITGKSIGNIRDGILVVEIDNQAIPVMKKEYAEAMLFESFDGRFKLSHDDAHETMVICDFVSTIKSKSKSNT